MQYDAACTAHQARAYARTLQSMYIRVKRQKTTVFLQVEPTDTVLEVKQKLQALLDKVSCCTWHACATFSAKTPSSQLHSVMMYLLLHRHGSPCLQAKLFHHQPAISLLPAMLIAHQPRHTPAMHYTCTVMGMDQHALCSLLPAGP